ncbi:MAG TPA: M15 family metallopeptidase [Leptospiraceae bacterium]|nr:M15 family metallopeptidase [Leptospiraceae bacterium]HMW08486.1 M15 family metallopeptidase [Leptospiraceae bacterium]HMX33326.1 M15 family metallopeptidase [Leptospiraceae bacterium]HMY34071.1 M15 family metallopeptidase [Leptospiraceae bacterium]HMZ64588.1 M15 family metallopeptidase [Leptospiraceae bacterium]
MNYLSKSKIFYLFFFILPILISLSANDLLYGKVDRVKYLMGDYPREGNLKVFTNEIEKNTHTLREDTIKALKQMIEAYDRDREGKSKQHIFVVSAHRSYADQKSIWEQKFKGTRKMRESIEGKTPEQIVNLILEYSSAPGTSRHHWGTDIDINALQNDYFTGKGNGAFLYEWLQKNAHKYGFCQPYNELSKRNNKGYNEEKWHWSYARVANQLQKEWEEAYKKKEITFTGKFSGSDVLGDRPLEYVTSINSDCKNVK